MTTQPYEIRDDVRLTVRAREFSRDVRIEVPGGANSGVASIDGAPGPAHHLPRGRGLDSPFGTTYRWTDAHSAAARFLGECFAFGAVCGLVVEMARSTRGR